MRDVKPGRFKQEEEIKNEKVSNFTFGLGILRHF